MASSYRKQWAWDSALPCESVWMPQYWNIEFVLKNRKRVTIEFLVTAQQMLHEMTRSCVRMLVRWLWMECVLCKTNAQKIFFISLSVQQRLHLLLLHNILSWAEIHSHSFACFIILIESSPGFSHKIGITVQGWIHFRGGHYEGFVSWFCLLRAVCVSFWSSEEQLETALAMMQNLRRRISLRSR